MFVRWVKGCAVLGDRSVRTLMMFSLEPWRWRDVQGCLKARCCGGGRQAACAASPTDVRGSRAKTFHAQRWAGLARRKAKGRKKVPRASNMTGRRTSAGLSGNLARPLRSLSGRALQPEAQAQARCKDQHILTRRATHAAANLPSRTPLAHPHNLSANHTRLACVRLGHRSSYATRVPR